DVGCGNGAFTEQLIACCAPEAVIAIDPSDDQLAYARVRPGVSAADLRLGDAQNLLFTDGSFDVAVMALVIYFLPDPDKAVAEMARVVRPGGHIDHSRGHTRSSYDRTQQSHRTQQSQCRYGWPRYGWPSASLRSALSLRRRGLLNLCVMRKADLRWCLRTAT